MNARTLYAWSPSLARAWERWSRRERMLVLVAAAVVVGGCGWAWWWQPMSADIARMERDRARTERVLAAAQAQADDLVALQRASVPVRSADPRAAIERALAARGLRATVTTPEPKEGRTRVALDAIRFVDLVSLLDTLARADGLRVVEANIAARVEPGMVRADLALAR